MNSKHLLMMLLLALFAPWAANAQTEIVIGTGETTSSNLPVYALYENSYSQQLFTAEEIGMAGSITSISFFPTTASSYDRVVDIYMLNVDRTAFASTSEWEAVTASDLVVANATIPTSITNDWVTIELSTPFDYDGTSTLLVAVNDHTGSWNGKSFSADANMTGKSLYINRDNTAYDPTTIASGGSVLNTRNNIKLEITPAGGVTCARPTNFAVSNVTAHAATLTWEGTADEGFNVEYQKTTDQEWTRIGTSANTWTLDNLDAATAYNVRVQAVCDADNELYSGWVNASFTTECDAYDIPYTYGFEDAAPFACWTVISGNITCQSGTANTGSYRLDFRGTTSNMIALPQFNEATNNLRVEFWTRPENTGGNSGKFAIGYMTDITDASTFVAVETYNSTEMTTTYVKKTVDFVNVPANANIAMRQFECSTYYYWYVDDVTVKEIPSCVAPTGLAAATTTNSAELSWTANSGENAWTLYWKESSATDYTEIANAT